MKRIAITIVCLMLIAGCAMAGQPNQPAAQTKATTADKVEKRLVELDKLIRVTAERIEKLPLWSQRQAAVKEAVSKDPKVQDIESKLAKTPEWIQLQNLQTERRYLENLK